MDNIKQYENICYSLYSVKRYYLPSVIQYMNIEGKKIEEFFNIKLLPQEFKAKIFIENGVDFVNNKKQNTLIAETSLAYTINFNEIHIIEFESINERFSDKDYLKMILHEYIHFLQSLFSQVLPSKYVWWYETVACYMAQQQENDLCISKVSWEKYTIQFYEIPNCYGLAYEFGKYIFNSFSKKDCLQFIKYPYKYERVFKASFEKFMSFVCTERDTELL